jgi:D-alanyl-D-alanine carboxypeptidase
MKQSIQRLLRIPLWGIAGVLFYMVTGSPAFGDNCQYESKAPESVVTALDKFLSSVVDPDDKTAALFGTAPGAVLMVKTPEWTYLNSKGVSDIESKTPLRCDSPFEIGSNTKMMTATVVMQLAEEGRLSLDDPLSRHLPDLAAQIPHGDKITLRQLASHTSGIFSYTDNATDGTPGIMEGALGDASMLKKGYTPAQLVKFAIDHGKPGFEPGESGKWAYSNTGFILLGMIIEKLDGEPLDKIFERRIFKPAGMQHTQFWNGVPEDEFGLPKAYFKAPYTFETSQWNMSQGWAAGAVISTPDDMARFMRALAEGRLFRKAETFEKMINGGGPADYPFLTYGIGIGGKSGGAFGHGGQTLGFQSDVGIFPKEDVVVILWTNVANSLAGVGLQFIEPALRAHELLGADK